jgi:hypothetical protein
LKDIITMSLINGLFTLPYFQAERAYRVATLKFSGPRPGARIDASIREKMQEFLEHSGIRQDLIFLEAGGALPTAAGTNIFMKGCAIITLPEWLTLDENACSWMIKHELSHIKNSDAFTTLCISGTCQLAASIFGMRYLSFWPALGLAYAVGETSDILSRRWREAKADDFAIENSSDEELKGGRRSLKALQTVLIRKRTTRWKQLKISSSGNYMLDISHPSLTSRIQKIEDALRARGITIEIDDPSGKEAVLAHFLSQSEKIVYL